MRVSIKEHSTKPVKDRLEIWFDKDGDLNIKIVDTTGSKSIFINPVQFDIARTFAKNNRD